MIQTYLFLASSLKSSLSASWTSEMRKLFEEGEAMLH